MTSLTYFWEALPDGRARMSCLKARLRGAHGDKKESSFAAETLPVRLHFLVVLVSIPVLNIAPLKPNLEFS